jgi:hypothetical protein
MKGKIFTVIFLLSSYISFSQTPEDALRLSWFQLKGTARNQAIGGAMASLGGDATANHINPAGLAFFKTSDVFITPGLQFGKSKSMFRGTNSTGEGQTKFNLGTSGFVFGGFGYKAKNSFGITVTQQADFNYTTYYKGLNDYSSYAEPLADEFAASNLYPDDALKYDSKISIPTRMAIYTYLVDTATVNGSLTVIAHSENPAVRDQENRVESSGGITEINLGWGTEASKKFMAGLSLGINIINQERRTYFHESDATGDADNDFSFLTYDETLIIKGYGLNLRGGLIYRPKEYIRLGLAVHTPTWMSLKETVSSGFAADLENLFGAGHGYDSVGMATITGGSDQTETRYVLNSPTKIMISGSYVFREVQDITRQKGFITLDIEYTNYKWMSYGPDEGEPNTETKDDYKPYNEAIDAVYKGTFNFRLGGELKFKTIMARAGFAYYTSPYVNEELKGRKMFVSGGLGYRNKGMFIDLTYVQRLNKDVNFPYRVNPPRANTFADLKENGGNVLLTVGFKI